MQFLEGNMIQATKLIKQYATGTGKITVLNGITLTVKKGEFLAITGKSGSGKSTLMYQLSLLDQPTSGRVVLDGIDTERLTDEQRVKYRLRELGFVFQDYALIPSLTAAENIMTPLLMLGNSQHDAYTIAANALTRVGLSDKLDSLPSQLSGGQQQRVSIARAIAHQPKIIFADEPTANLDSETSDQVLKTFLEIHRQGQTIVMVTHETEYARLTDRIITLSDGNIIADVKTRKSRGK